MPASCSKSIAVPNGNGDFLSYKCCSDLKVTLSEKLPSWVKGEPHPSLKLGVVGCIVFVQYELICHGRNMEPGVCLLSFEVPLRHRRICHFFVHVELLEGEGRMLVLSWPCLVRKKLCEADS